MLENFSQRRSKQETSAQNIQKKSLEDLGEPIQKVVPQRSNPNQAKNQSEGATGKMEKYLKSKEGTYTTEKNMQQLSQKKQQRQNQRPVQTEEQKSAKYNINNSLKTSNTNLSSQLGNFYQSMLKNCLKKSQEEPHKLQNCLDEFTTKMKPIYKQMQQQSTQSADNLKKCFQSKRNAQECIQEGIKFGKQSLQDVTNSFKSYIA